MHVLSWQGYATVYLVLRSSITTFITVVDAPFTREYCMLSLRAQCAMAQKEYFVSPSPRVGRLLLLASNAVGANAG
jgi:hypothetical protein